MIGIGGVKYKEFQEAYDDIGRAEAVKCIHAPSYLNQGNWYHHNRLSFDIIHIRHEIYLTIWAMVSNQKVVFGISELFDEMDMILDESYKHLFVPCLRIFSPLLHTRFDRALLVDELSQLNLSQLIGKCEELLLFTNNFVAGNTFLDEKPVQFLVKTCIPLLEKIIRELRDKAKSIKGTS